MWISVLGDWRTRFNRGLLLVLVVLVLAGSALAGESSNAETTAPKPTLDTGDTAWVLISSALVMLMTPGLAFFYGGLVRRKNYLSVLMQCMIILGVLSLQWVLFGYSLSFAPGSKWLGSLDWVGLKGVGLEPYADYAATIPHQAFMIFQAMFAVITPALIIGAFAERMKFSAFLVFTLLWATLVYDPVAHWVWGVGGLLRNLGALDFAGGTVVHINAGIAALVTALVIGKRKSVDKHPIPPHSLPFSVLGAALLWFGWFGFNAGSCPGCQRPGGQCLCGDPYRRRRRRGHVGRAGLDDQRGADHAGHDLRCGGRTRGHHACGGIRRSGLGHCDRCTGQCVLLHGRQLRQTEVWVR